MSRERVVSIVGGRASRYVTLKRPSKLIPFKGKFPLLEPYQMEAYSEAIQSTQYMEDLPKEFQDITEKGNRIGIMEDSFKSYLADFNLTPYDFLELNDSDKSDMLMNWLNRDCLDFSQLTIS